MYKLVVRESYAESLAYDLCMQKVRNRKKNKRMLRYCLYAGNNSSSYGGKAHTRRHSSGGDQHHKEQR